MIPQKDTDVKILFRSYNDLLEQDAVESMWANVVDSTVGYYKIDNIPLYVPLLASDDIIQAEYDEEEGMLTYRQTIQPSGNSTIWVVMTDEEVDIDDVRKRLYDLGCNSEAPSDQYFSLEIKATINYLRIKDELNRLRTDGIIDYVEPCLSVQHQY
ncbi:MAG: DUF4265 domain-containing protein [Williamsia sp.]|nr:DUF4265 domain-containing protein [Williamsia sp.]